jgi:hypothetical protein
LWSAPKKETFLTVKWHLTGVEDFNIEHWSGGLFWDLNRNLVTWWGFGISLAGSFGDLDRDLEWHLLECSVTPTAWFRDLALVAILHILFWYNHVVTDNFLFFYIHFFRSIVFSDSRTAGWRISSIFSNSLSLK